MPAAPLPSPCLQGQLLAWLTNLVLAARYIVAVAPLCQQAVRTVTSIDGLRYGYFAASSHCAGGAAVRCSFLRSASCKRLRGGWVLLLQCSVYGCSVSFPCVRCLLELSTDFCIPFSSARRQEKREERVLNNIMKILQQRAAKLLFLCCNIWHYVTSTLFVSMWHAHSAKLPQPCGLYAGSSSPPSLGTFFFLSAFGSHADYMRAVPPPQA